MSLVERIRSIAELRELTLAKIERDLGLGNGTIRKWDNNAPSVDKVQKVGEYLNVSIDYLLGRTDNTNVFRGGKENIKYELPKQAVEELTKSIEGIINKYIR